MIYAAKTVSVLLQDPTPKEVLPLAQTLLQDTRLHGAKGRALLRKTFGTEHENAKDNAQRPFPVWRFVLQGQAVLPAPTDIGGDDLPTLYLLGPRGALPFAIALQPTTTGPDAAVLLRALAKRLRISL